MEKYDAAIVLGHELVKDCGKLKMSPETKERVDLGISLLFNNFTDKLIMSGGHGDKGQKYGKSIAHVMKEYAISQGIKEKNIFVEDISLDTAGQLLFCKLGITEPLKIRKLILVTHEYHLKRVKLESELIFYGKKISYASVNSPFSEETEKSERRSTLKFLKTFKGAKAQDFLKILSEKYPQYKEYVDLSNRINHIKITFSLK